MNYRAGIDRKLAHGKLAGIRDTCEWQIRQQLFLENCLMPFQILPKICHLCYFLYNISFLPHVQLPHSKSYPSFKIRAYIVSLQKLPLGGQNSELLQYLVFISLLIIIYYLLFVFLMYLLTVNSALLIIKWII